MSQIRPFAPSDIALHVTPGQLDVHRDRIVYTLRSVADDAERTELWSVSPKGGDAQRLTSGPAHDSCPRLSPDGRRVAFLRSAGGAPAQLNILSLENAAVVQVCHFARGVVDFDWSPDGAWLAVLAPDHTSPRVVDGQGSPTAVVLRRADWRRDGADNAGLDLYPQHLHRVSLDDGSTRRLTSGEWSASRPRVDGDGSVYYIADTEAWADIRRAPQVHRVASSGVTEVCTEFAGGVIRFHVLDGVLRVLGHGAHPRREDVPPQLLEIRPGREPITLLGAVDGWLGHVGEETDLHEWQRELDDSFAMTALSRGGSTIPIEVPSGHRLATPPVACGALAAHGEVRVAVLCMGDGFQAPDVYALEAAGPRRLTQHGRWAEEFLAPISESREVAGPAGPISVQLLLPPVGVPYRGTVVSLHGGPNAQWGPVPPLESLLLASEGFRVAMPNIRGSIDRGAAWARALDGDWGDADAADVLAVCEALIEAGEARPGRIGLVGRSYGGFLTQWLVGTSDIFGAAVAEGGVANQVAAWGSSDAGPSFSEGTRLGSAVTERGVAELWACSPLRNVAQVHTPLLMLQGADDRVCPASDNEQLFVALRALGRDVEYVLYPAESHQMQGTARLDRRIDRHQRVIDWFVQHLG